MGQHFARTRPSVKQRRDAYNLQSLITNYGPRHRLCPRSGPREHRELLLWYRRIFWIIWLNKLNQPVFVSLVYHRRKWRDDVYPRSSRVKGDKITLRVDKVHG